MIDNFDEKDYMEKNWKTQDEIDSANERLVSLSKVKSTDEGEKVEIIEVDGNKFHKRSKEDYENIYEAFLDLAEPEFKEYFKYGKDEIEKIGIKEFIDTLDWRGAADVFSWKTDRMHVIICPHCNSKFILFEDSLGLCQDCEQYYDLDKLVAVINSTAEEAGKISGKHVSSSEGVVSSKVAIAALGEFVYDEDVRKLFLKENA